MSEYCGSRKRGQNRTEFHSMLREKERGVHTSPTSVGNVDSGILTGKLRPLYDTLVSNR